MPWIETVLMGPRDEEEKNLHWSSVAEAFFAVLGVGLLHIGAKAPGFGADLWPRNPLIIGMHTGSFLTNRASPEIEDKTCFARIPEEPRKVETCLQHRSNVQRSQKKIREGGRRVCQLTALSQKGARALCASHATSPKKPRKSGID